MNGLRRQGLMFDNYSLSAGENRETQKTTNRRTIRMSETAIEKLDGRVVVIHTDGWELFNVSEPDAEEVTQFTDSLPGENPDVAAFNADAHPDHPSVEMVESAYETLDVRETLREMRRSVVQESESVEDKQ